MISSKVLSVRIRALWSLAAQLVFLSNPGKYYNRLVLMVHRCSPAHSHVVAQVFLQACRFTGYTWGSWIGHTDMIGMTTLY